MPEDLIERVARAMWGAREAALPERVRRALDALDEVTGAMPLARIMAAAALRTMRDPTPEMIAAGRDAYDRALRRPVEGPIESAFRAMIDVAGESHGG